MHGYDISATGGGNIPPTSQIISAQMPPIDSGHHHHHPDSTDSYVTYLEESDESMQASP